MAANGLSSHLIHFLEEHIKVHGKTIDSHRYIMSSIELWRGKYGDPVAADVTKAVKKMWSERKS